MDKKIKINNMKDKAIRFLKQFKGEKYCKLDFKSLSYIETFEKEPIYFPKLNIFVLIINYWQVTQISPCIEEHRSFKPVRNPGFTTISTPFRS